MAVWAIEAETSDSMLTLMQKWWGIFRLGPAASDSHELQGQFLAALKNSLPVALVVHQSHLLPGEVIDRMRLFAEEGALVVLQGDVSIIDMSTRAFPSFFQRASYCIEVTRLFPAHA